MLHWMIQSLNALFFVISFLKSHNIFCFIMLNNYQSFRRRSEALECHCGGDGEDNFYSNSSGRNKKKVLIGQRRDIFQTKIAFEYFLSATTMLSSTTSLEQLLPVTLCSAISNSYSTLFILPFVQSMDRPWISVVRGNHPPLQLLKCKKRW